MLPKNERTTFEFVSSARSTNAAAVSPSKAMLRDHVKWPMWRAAAGDHDLGEK